MRISAISIENFKRVHHVKISPPADRSLILIGGKNAQGKSSVLDALTAAFGGKRTLPADPVRHGAEAAVIRVELDGGALTVQRVIDAEGNGQLEVRDAMGAVRSPQAMLDQIVSARFLDPLAYLALPPKDQRAALMKLIDGAERIEALDGKRQRAFDARTEVHRDRVKAQGELARLPVAAEVGDPIDIAALANERATFAEQQRAGDGLGNELKQAEKDAAIATEREVLTLVEIEDLERRLASAKAKLEALHEGRADALARATELRGKLNAVAVQWKATEARRAQIDAELARAGEHNRKVIEAESATKRRAEAAEATAKLDAEHARLTSVLDTIDARKAEILAAAKLPVEGLGVDDAGVTLNGVPFAQASRAEQFRVAMTLAFAASPQLEDVWVKDGAVLDDESLEQLAALATAAGRRCWVEVVGDPEEDAVIIVDGKVRGAPPPEATPSKRNGRASLPT